MEINDEPEKNQEISLKKTIKKLVSEHPEAAVATGAIVVGAIAIATRPMPEVITWLTFKF